MKRCRFALKLIIIIALTSCEVTYAKHTNSFPAWVECKPNYIKVDIEDKSFPREFQVLLVNGNLSLYRLTPSYLSLIPPNLCRKLFKFLGKHKLHIRWRDTEAKLGSGKMPRTAKMLFPLLARDNSNAATALFLLTSIQTRDNVLLSQLLVSGAKEICSGLKGNAGIVLTPDVMGNAVITLARNIPTNHIEARRTGINTSESIQNIAILTQSYLKYWAEKDPKRVKEILNKIIKDSRALSLNPGQLGAFFGSIIAGADNLLFEIVDSTTKKLLAWNLVSNIAVISSNLIGLLSLHPAFGVGAAGMAIPVVIDVPIAVAPDIAALKAPSELFYKHLMKEIQGKLEMQILQHMTEDNEEQIISLLDWMKTAIHINGHSN